MSKSRIIFILLLSLLSALVYSQTGSVSGTITDSVTRQPIVNFSIFIPFTTTGTTTNARGEYLLEKLPPGDYALMFRHIAYHSYTSPMKVEPGQKLVVNIMASENSYKIEEVVKIGKVADWNWGYSLFKEFFLGDPWVLKCELLNPKDLKFYTDGEIITAYSLKPLEIINKHLGYSITYYLDFFKFAVNNNPAKNSIQVPYFSFSGNAFYKDLYSGRTPLTGMSWVTNRETEFKGSLKHFLLCLYRNTLAENRYSLRKAYWNVVDFAEKEKLAGSMAKIGMTQADSVFCWYPAKNQMGYLHYLPLEEYLIPPDSITNGPLPGEKTAVFNDFILIFKDFKGTAGFHDDRTSTLRLPTGKIIFDEDGNYRLTTGELEWADLENSARLKNVLPRDYLPGYKATGKRAKDTPLP